MCVAARCRCLAGKKDAPRWSCAFRTPPAWISSPDLGALGQVHVSFSPTSFDGSDADI